MTKNEALQMCLEYIETDAHERKYVRHAIKAALEQPAQPEQEVSCRFCHDKGGCWAWQCYHCGEIDDVQQPTPPAAQPMQEPVAWRDPTNIDPGQGCTYKKEWREKWPHIYRQALYTTPPAAQRPWVGLTDQDRNACLVSADPCEALADPEAKQLMEDVEAALRSKNK